VSSDPRLARWLHELVSTPGLTGIRDPALAWRVHVEESLRAVDSVRQFPGAVVDVGSGGGSPGLPLAACLPEREIVLLESSKRKAAFLERVARDFANVRVVRGRAEEQPLETYGVAVARALAPPVVALEWCLPLVACGGAAILFVGSSTDLAGLARAAEKLGGASPEFSSGLAVVRKVAPTPPGFPRRPGMARKRPLA